MASMQDRLRATYERAQAKFPEFQIQTQVLRREIPLNNTRNGYAISLKAGQGNNPFGDSGSEIFLDQNDAFVMCGLSVAVKKQDTTLSPAQYGNFPLFTYPDPQYFIGAPAGQAIESAALMCIWNGTLSFRTNVLQRIKAMDTSKFLFTPPTQVKNAIATDADTYPGNGQTQQSLPEYGGWDWESQGFIELQPTMLLDGAENNQFELGLGNGSITAIDGSYAADGDRDATSRNVVVLRAYGLLIPDGSKAAKKFADSWRLQG